MPERLRGWTRNPLGSARRGSNPLAVAFQSSPGGTARIGRGERAAAESGSTLLIDKNILRNKDTHGWGTLLWTSCISTPALAGGEALSFTGTGLGTAALPRQCVRAAKEMDSKSIGLCPQGFQSPRCRFRELQSSPGQLEKARLGRSTSTWQDISKLLPH